MLDHIYDHCNVKFIVLVEAENGNAWGKACSRIGLAKSVWECVGENEYFDQFAKEIDQVKQTRLTLV